MSDAARTESPLQSPTLRRYVLAVPCLACNAESGSRACARCARLEDAERAVGKPSPQLVALEADAVPLAPGARVRHTHAHGITGTVVVVAGDYVRVRWDHYGLAVAQLGVNADLQRPATLERA